MHVKGKHFFFFTKGTSGDETRELRVPSLYVMVTRGVHRSRTTLGRNHLQSYLYVLSNCHAMPILQFKFWFLTRILDHELDFMDSANCDLLLLLFQLCIPSFCHLHAFPNTHCDIICNEQVIVFLELGRKGSIYFCMNLILFPWVSKDLLYFLFLMLHIIIYNFVAWQPCLSWQIYQHSHLLLER